MIKELTKAEGQLADEQAIIDMEKGNEIPLKEWAEKNGVNDSLARRKAREGKYKTARKLGRDWVINELEKDIDHRKSGFSKRWEK